MVSFSLVHTNFLRKFAYGCLLLAAGLLAAPVARADIGDLLELSVKRSDLHAGPSVMASGLVTIKKNDLMIEMERQGSWVFVALKKSGVQGWIQASKVRKPVEKGKKNKKGKRKSNRRVSAAPIAPYVVRQWSLKDLGFRRGVMFEGTAAAHAHTFFFNSPLDSRITGGTFRLMYRASPNLNELSTIRISVNDVPYRQVGAPKDDAPHEVNVTLPASAFKGEVVKITIRSTLLVSEDRCFDDRINGTFLHVMPGSSLKISYRPVEKSIRDAWRLLPSKVTISIPAGRLSRDQFASTLAIMELLVENGKKVQIQRLPIVGDIVVAPKGSIDALVSQRRWSMTQGQPALQVGKSFDAAGNIALIRFANRSAIAITDPYDVQPMYLLNDEWKLIGAGQHYRVYKPDNLRAQFELLDNDSDYYSLPLSRMGLETGPRYITRETSWQTVIAPFALPSGTRPDFLNLNVIAPVHWEKDPSFEMYVFLNDVLVKSARLENTGLKQNFTVNLPQEYQQQYNNIRIIMQHDVEQGDCRGVMPHDFIQIAPDSALVVKKDETTDPVKFSDLARYFSQGFDVYLESSYLDNPERVLQLLARLAADFPLSIDYSRLFFTGRSDVLEPENPFVAVGRFTLGDDIEAPVRFDSGRVKILSPGGESYFDVNLLPHITIAEIAKTSSSYGLWVNPSDVAGLPVLEKLSLSEDDVAFIDSLGVIKTMDSSQPSLAQVYYPDVEDWFDTLGKYRFWLMILLWFLLTMIVVYLYRMSRSNRRAREIDDSRYREDEFERQGDHAAHMREDGTTRPGHALDHLDEKK